MDANGDPGSAIAGGYTGTILPNIFVDDGSPTTYTASANSAASIAVSSAYAANPLSSPPRPRRDRATAT